MGLNWFAEAWCEGESDEHLLQQIEASSFRWLESIVRRRLARDVTASRFVVANEISEGDMTFLVASLRLLAALCMNRNQFTQDLIKVE